jgi:hypothetical protein
MIQWFAPIYDWFSQTVCYVSVKRLLARRTGFIEIGDAIGWISESDN